jgi:hypothetical protein
MCKNKGKFRDFEKFDCRNLQYQKKEYDINQN